MPINRATLFFSLLLLNGFCAAAQEATGTAYRKISNSRLNNVIITNLNSGTVAISDALGNFVIKATVYDTLQFNKKDFTLQKQQYHGYAVIAYMQPEIKLAGVTVTGQTKKKELNEIVKGYRNKGLYFDGRPPLIIFNPINGSPITGFYELFGKDARNERRFIKFMKKEVAASEIERRYNKLLVMQVTGLNDTTAAIKFMDFWSPSLNELKTWADYDLIKQINAKYEFYLKAGDQKVLPKL